LRDLNDLYPRIEASTSALELHSAILSCLAPGVGKVRSEKVNYPVAQVNQVTAVSSDSMYNNTGSQNQNKNQNNSTGNGTGRNKNRNQQNQQSRARNRSRGRNQSKQGNQKNCRGRSCSKSTGKPYFVKPWPKNEPYLTRDKKSFLPAFEEHFKNFCYRCGLSNHSAKNCRIYPDAKIIMELCGVCCMGLHDRCKNYKFTKPRDSSTGSGSGSGTNNQSSSNAKNTNQVISGYILPDSSYDDENAIQLATEED
jgi:hypothetical protein